MAHVISDECKKTYRRVKLSVAFKAIEDFTKSRIGELYSEVEAEFRMTKTALDEISSYIGAMQPRVGRVMSLAEFQEYVELQRQLLEKAKKLPVSMQEILGLFQAMLEDSLKLIAPGRYSKFVTEELYPKIVESKRYRGIKKDNALEVIHRFVLGNVNESCLQIELRNKTISDAISRIDGLNPRIGEEMTIAHFEEYVKLLRLVVEEAKCARSSKEKIQEVLESMFPDSMKLVLPSGRYHKFVTEPLPEDLREAEKPPTNKEFPLMNKIASYIFILLPIVASMIVFL